MTEVLTAILGGIGFVLGALAYFRRPKRPVVVERRPAEPSQAHTAALARLKLVQREVREERQEPPPELDDARRDELLEKWR